jgi:DMSO/TMAO reductase YedYZ molybdopterin-dependent catalytic subunit
MSVLSRRKLLKAGLATTAGVAGLAVADRLAHHFGLVPPDAGGLFGPGESLTYATQSLLTRHAMAREFPRSMISANPFAVPIAPPTAAFQQSQARGFSDWRLTVDGLVRHPASFSLADLKSMPQQSQTTEIACEEGWSYVAEWIGAPLQHALREVGVLPQARYVTYFSVEPGEWDSLDMHEAMHPQTILAMGMNNSDLPVAFGGPLRMRVPLQIGYKNIKFIHHITVTDSMKGFGKGLGSAAPEEGYAWFAGI